MWLLSLPLHSPTPVRPHALSLSLFAHSLIGSLSSTFSCLSSGPSFSLRLYQQLVHWSLGLHPLALQPILALPERDHFIPNLTPCSGPHRPAPPPTAPPNEVPAPGPMQTCCRIWARLPLPFVSCSPQRALQTPPTSRHPPVSPLCIFVFALVLPSAWNALSDSPLLNEDNSSPLLSVQYVPGALLSPLHALQYLVYL